MVILIDTNILIDYLAQRADFLPASRIIDYYCAEDIVKGFVAAHSITDIFYILRKDFSQNERRQILLSLLDILDVANLDKEKLLKSLYEKDFLDFEDCLQSKCAEEIHADYIITRNPKDFQKSTVPVLSADGFVKHLEA